MVTGAALAFLAANNAAGHGSALPFNMFVAPGGFGIAVWPLGFAICGLPRKWSLAVLVCVIALLCLHNYFAWCVYDADAGAERSNLHSLTARNSTMSAMIGIDLVGAYAVQAFLVIFAIGRWASVYLPGAKKIEPFHVQK